MLNPTTDEKELLRLLRAGEQSAFDTLYGRYWETLYQTAFYLIKDAAASMDIVQDIFVWLWERREKLEIQSFQAYLKAAVKFKVANYIRDGKIRESFFGELQPIATGNAAIHDAEVRELKAIIDQSILELPDKCRTIYLLSKQERLSNKEIAEQLGISVKTVEAQMTIALKRIRNAVGKYMLAALAASEFLR